MIIIKRGIGDIQFQTSIGPVVIRGGRTLNQLLDEIGDEILYNYAWLFEDNIVDDNHPFRGFVITREKSIAYTEEKDAEEDDYVDNSGKLEAENGKLTGKRVTAKARKCKKK